MPRYLGINYTKLLLEDKQILFTRCQLAVPTHLECVQSYAHCPNNNKASIVENPLLDRYLKGTLGTCQFSAGADEESYLDLIKNLGSLYFGSSKLSSSSLETYSEVTDTLVSDDIIPSSNPMSPAMAEDLSRESRHVMELELLPKSLPNLRWGKTNDLPSMDENIYTDKIDLESLGQYMLEETEELGVTDDFMQLSTVTKLCARLKPVKVTDPFKQLKSLCQGLQYKTERHSDPELADPELKTQVSQFEPISLSSLETGNQEQILEVPIDFAYTNIKTSPNLSLRGPFTDENIENDPEVTRSELVAIKEIGSIPLVVQETVENVIQTVLCRTHDIDNGIYGPYLAPLGLKSDDTRNGKLESPISDLACECKDSENPLDVFTTADLKEEVLADERSFINRTYLQEVLSKSRNHEIFLGDLHKLLMPEPTTDFQWTDASVNTRDMIDTALQTIVPEQNPDNALDDTLRWDPFSGGEVMICKRKAVDEMSLERKGRQFIQRSTKKPVHAEFSKIPIWEIQETFEKESFDPKLQSTSKQTTSYADGPRQISNAESSISTIGKISSNPQEKSTQERKSVTGVVRPVANIKCTEMKSPLDDFVALRTGIRRRDNLSSSVLKDRRPLFEPSKCTVKAAKIKPSVFRNEEKSPNPSKVEQSSKNNDKEQGDNVGKVVKDVVYLTLTDDFCNVLVNIRAFVKPYLNTLKRTSVVPPKMEYESLTPDYTRFILRQEEEAARNIMDKDSDQMSKLEAAIVVHATCWADFEITDFGIPAGLDAIVSVGRKHPMHFRVLDHLHQYLWNEDQTFTSKNVMHPVINKSIEMLRSFISSSQQSKAVLLLPDNGVNLIQPLLSALRETGKLTPWSPNDESTHPDCRDFDNYNVYILVQNSKLLQFPWTKIDHVIEMRYDYESDWHNTLFHLNPNFLRYSALMVERKGAGLTPYNDTGKQVTSKSSLGNVIIAQSGIHYIIIARSLMEKDRASCLVELESAHNIALIQKDYNVLYQNLVGLRHYWQPDMLINETTAVVFHDTNGVQDEIDICEKVRIVAMKCSKCYVIICTDKSSDKLKDAWQGANELSQLSRDPTVSNQGFNLNLMYSFSSKSLFRLLSTLIKQLGQNMDFNQGTPTDQFVVQEHWTKHEVFLLSFPFLNCYSVNSILRMTSLKEMSTWSQETMERKLSRICAHSVEALWLSLQHPPETAECQQSNKNSFSSAPRYPFLIDDRTLLSPVENRHISNSAEYDYSSLPNCGMNDCEGFEDNDILRDLAGNPQGVDGSATYEDYFDSRHRVRYCDTITESNSQLYDFTSPGMGVAGASNRCPNISKSLRSSRTGCNNLQPYPDLPLQPTFPNDKYLQQEAGILTKGQQPFKPFSHFGQESSRFETANCIKVQSNDLRSSSTVFDVGKMYNHKTAPNHRFEGLQYNTRGYENVRYVKTLPYDIGSDFPMSPSIERTNVMHDFSPKQRNTSSLDFKSPEFCDYFVSNCASYPDNVQNFSRDCAKMDAREHQYSTYDGFKSHDGQPLHDGTKRQLVQRNQQRLQAQMGWQLSGRGDEIEERHRLQVYRQGDHSEEQSMCGNGVTSRQSRNENVSGKNTNPRLSKRSNSMVRKERSRDQNYLCSDEYPRQNPSLVPYKKRKLTYRKDPFSNDGQTKLSFF